MKWDMLERLDDKDVFDVYWCGIKKCFVVSDFDYCEAYFTAQEFIRLGYELIEWGKQYADQ